ncbi:lipocalin-like domain-containing protein [Halovulum sp. GXIMD14793]
MINKALFLLLSLLASPALSQGYAGLGTEAEGFAVPDPATRLTFPADHQPHPGFRIEWWYLTANLTAADGTEMGLQWTLFRQAAAADGPQIWMGHAAITMPDQHRSAETFARGGIGQAGVVADPFEAFIDDWSMRAVNDGIDQLRLTASGADFSYDVALRAEGPLVLQGRDGYSVKAESGQASHYYSQPFFALDGHVTLDGVQIEVTGQAWLDREWSSQPLASDQEGWDWLSLHFDDGAKLMAFRLRGASDYIVGTWIGADGTPTPLPPGTVGLIPLAESQVAGRSIPTEWRVRYPDQSVDVEVTAINPQAYMQTLFPYWEGPISVSGSHPGRGYLEMTGYPAQP